MKLGNNIRTFRKEKGLTQEELAEAIGVSPQAVSKWETGQAMPDVTMILPICSVLGVSADRLLGGNRRAELEKNFQKSIPLGIGAELIACQDALKEYPDDETFLYRRAVNEFLIGQKKNNEVHLSRALSQFLQLVKKYPDNDAYRSFLAQVYHACGRQEDAIRTANGCKDKEILLGFILEGEELVRHRQKGIFKTVNKLIKELRQYNTKEALALEDELRQIYFGDVGEFCHARWFTYYKLGELYLAEGDGMKYAECMEKAYDLAKIEDEKGSLPYNSPLTDRLKKHPSDPRETEQFLSVTLADNEAGELKKRIIAENYIMKPLYRQNVYSFVGFFYGYAHGDCPNMVDYSTNWCKTKEEHDEFLSSFIKESKKYNASGLLLDLRSKQEAISLIESGRLKGTVAWLGNLNFVGFCNCQAKNGYAALPIGEAERAVKTADCSDDKIFSIVSVDVAVYLRNCGMEERLILDTCEYAKDNGFLYCETYIGYNNENHISEIDRYTKLGFYKVREYKNDVFSGVILQKKL